MPRKAKNPAPSRRPAATRSSRAPAGRRFLASLPGKLFSDRHAAVQTLSWTTSTLLIAGLAGGLFFGHDALAARAAEVRRAPVSISFSWPTERGATESWLDPAARGRLEGLALARLGDNPFDQNALEDAHAALDGTGWFESLRLIRQRSGAVRVDAAWRTPYATVRPDRSERALLVSRDAAVIEGPDAWRLRSIIGVKLDPPDRFGRSWEGGEVQSGIALLGYLDGTPGWDQVRAIDVSAYLRSKQLVIVTDRAHRVVWGGPVGEFNPGQPTDERKRAFLRSAYEQFGRIDAGQPLLDLTSDPPMIDRTTGG